MGWRGRDRGERDREAGEGEMEWASQARGVDWKANRMLEEAGYGILCRLPAEKRVEVKGRVEI